MSTHTTESLMEVQAFISANLDYVDGELHWKPTAKSKMMRGKRAGFIEKKGYYVICMSGKFYKLHRVVFFMHHGYFPQIVDHINGDKLDNRIENLRSANHSQNTVNSGPRANNKCGLKGVSKLKSGKWQASIRANDGRKYLGSFVTPQEAHAAYAEAAIKYHGEFARFV